MMLSDHSISTSKGISECGITSQQNMRQVMHSFLNSAKKPRIGIAKSILKNRRLGVFHLFCKDSQRSQEYRSWCDITFILASGILIPAASYNRSIYGGRLQIRYRWPRQRKTTGGGVDYTPERIPKAKTKSSAQTACNVCAHRILVLESSGRRENRWESRVSKSHVCCSGQGYCHTSKVLLSGTHTLQLKCLLGQVYAKVLHCNAGNEQVTADVCVLRLNANSNYCGTSCW